jgi:hypothetical protein
MRRKDHVHGSKKAQARRIQLITSLGKADAFEPWPSRGCVAMEKARALLGGSARGERPSAAHTAATREENQQQPYIRSAPLNSSKWALSCLSLSREKEDGRRGGKTSRKCWLNNALKVVIVTPSLIDQVPAVVTPFLLCFRCESFTWWPLIALHGTFLMAFAALKHLTMLVVSKLVDLALPYLRADGS